MFTLLYKLHRFLLSQLVYPLALATFLSLSIFIGRVMLSDFSLYYRNLIWNLFLAWLPYLCSLVVAGLHRLFPRQWVLLIIPSLLWLIFFPNAAYILTDFTHLEERFDVPLWYDIFLVATFAWTGCFLAIVSLRTMQLVVKDFMGGFISWLFVAAALGLNALGIYLGRFQRWNSWDILIHPRSIFKDILVPVVDPRNNLRFVGFTLIFTAFLAVLYLMFVSFRHTEEVSTNAEQSQQGRHQA